MNKFVLLASLATLTLTAVSAEARDRWRNRHFEPWQDRPVYIYEDDVDDDIAYYDDAYEDEVVIIPKRYKNRRQRMLEAEQEVERDLWWLEDNARNKLEQRSKTRQQVKKPVVKKAVAKPLPSAKSPAAKSKVVAKATIKAPAPKLKPDLAPKSDKLQTASFSKPDTTAKPKVVTAKPIDKTIGCTAGAAVVTGYGFGEVKPKACTGSTYAYTAIRAGKSYEIKLAAASGEITDVKKLN